MKQMMFAALCSSLLAMSSLQAAAAPRHVGHTARTTPITSDQFRNAHAAIYAPVYLDNGMPRGNAEAAPAGR